MYLQQAGAGTSWKLATIRGHNIFVSPLFLLLVAFFVFMGLNSASDFFYQLMWAPVLFLSIILHELGHAAATKYFGFGTSKIVLHGMGGVAMNRRGHTTPKQGMVISLAGPAVTALLAGLAFVGLIVYQLTIAGETLSVFGFFLRLMLLANLFWLVFNLLPIYPLDGGQTVMHFLRRKGTQHAAMEKATKISLATLVLTAFIAIGVFKVGGILIILIFAMLGYSNWQTLQQLRGGGGPGRTRG